MAEFQLLPKRLELLLRAHTSKGSTHGLDNFMASIAGNGISIPKTLDYRVNVLL